MSLNNIQLPATLLQSLYNKSLFELKTGISDTDLIQAGKITFLGSNQKRIIVLVKSSETMYLPDDELNFLLGILTACKLSMADIALINVSNNANLLYTDIAVQLSAEKLFLFGVNAEFLRLPLQFPLYQIQNYNNQVYLSCVSISDLQTDKNEKLKLWNCLKIIFSLS